MRISSSSFTDQEFIPIEHAKLGENNSPPLRISDTPAEAASLALLCHDPDAPTTGGFTHWVVWNIPPDTKEIAAGTLPAGAKEGLNDWGRHAWDGPEPPSGTHRYIFYLHALDTSLDLPENTTRHGFDEAIGNHVIETATLTGLFSAETLTTSHGG